jgi:hypothetical protein
VAARYAALYQELLLGATRSRSVLAEART